MAVSTRQALLQALSAAGGSYVSGQQLAETLGVSRAAVHKAAAALTAQGYALEAAPRRGYRLAGGDPFCTEAIGDYPAPIYLYDTLESSNRTAKLLALDGAPHGTLVLTAHQSAGRGRLGRRFESPAGKGVYCSVLLRPEMPAANAQTATISAAVAVCRAVKKLCGLELAVKWVNDLYYQGRKVCGILTEAGTDLESGQLEWLVVGIGLNLTSTAADWPEELARRAGSLYPGGPAPVSRAALAGAIARELLALCPAFDCLDEYRARCFVPGHWVTVCAETETYAAKALAIDEEGRLVIQRETADRRLSLRRSDHTACTDRIKRKKAPFPARKECFFMFCTYVSRSTASSTVMSSFSKAVRIIPARPGISALFSMHRVIMPFRLEASTPMEPPSGGTQTLKSLMYC